MWYLHNEVVPSVPRKFGVTRILRYMVTMQNTQEFYGTYPKQFGPFVAFDSGMCTVPNCDQTWKKLGFNLGCQPLNSSRVAYFSPFTTHFGGRHCAPQCNDALWYSFPGPCPSKDHKGKTEECKQQMPGGRCSDISLLGKPDSECTYYTEKAGEVRLDDLVGIKDYQNWWALEHNKEYVWETDKGVGTDFWDSRTDAKRCSERMDKLQDLFWRKYPEMPITYGEPPCDLS
mmetsp:Transcript_74219/g.187620  ORF Transcript_74219/g.187620 Transcript_74219/m.187620 type:complete len:230 (-) Transcript_74219:110-799(-)